MVVLYNFLSTLMERVTSETTSGFFYGRILRHSEPLSILIMEIKGKESD